MTGRLVVKLWAASTAPDTDFTAKLVDVYPPNPDYPLGFDLNIGDRIVRARYRESLRRPSCWTPGQPAEFTIELYPTSKVFRKRAPHPARHLQQQLPAVRRQPEHRRAAQQNRRWSMADNTVYHDAQHPSRIILPIVPSSGTVHTGAR